MSRDVTPFGLRMQAPLKKALAAASAASGRSMNSELVSRLQASFESDFTSLPFEVMQAVEGEMAAQGITQEEALVRLVLAGQAGGSTVLNLKIAPGTTAKEVRDALTEALKHIPPDSNVVSTKL